MIRKIATKLILSILLVSGIGLIPQTTIACSCAGGSLEENYRTSENVFSAVITGGTATNERVGRSPQLQTEFEVTDTFKGTIPFGRLYSHANSNSCGISLQIGVEYLIFAPNSGKIGSCSGIVAISDLPEEREAIGPKYVAALRAFKSGENGSLAEPWYFSDYQGVCTLSARFLYGEKRWLASMNAVYWTRVPDEFKPIPDKPHLKAGFTELSIRVPGRDDLTNYPLRLSVNDESYAAQWFVDEHSRGRYIIDSEDVSRVIEGLASANAMQLRSAHPVYGDINTKASLVNAGDSVTKMAQCLEKGH